MEKSTPIGLVAGFVLIFGTILMGDGWATFIDPVSLLIVLGGTLAALLVGFSLEEVKAILPGIKACFGHQSPSLSGYLSEFSELSRMARREGLLALDRRMATLEDEFMKFGLEMAVDGIEEAEIDDLMRERIASEARQRALSSKFFNTAGTYAPAFGMVGTLIGLIQMLQNLSDPAAIGPAMAVAMITTFYGAFFANLICLPLANKIKGQTAELLKARDMVRVGVLSIVRGESPSMVEKRLQLFVGGDAAPAEDAPPPLAKAA